MKLSWRAISCYMKISWTKHTNFKRIPVILPRRHVIWARYSRPRRVRVCLFNKLVDRLNTTRLCARVFSRRISCTEETYPGVGYYATYSIIRDHHGVMVGPHRRECLTCFRYPNIIQRSASRFVKRTSSKEILGPTCKWLLRNEKKIINTNRIKSHNVII